MGPIISAASGSAISFSDVIRLENKNPWKGTYSDALALKTQVAADLALAQAAGRPLPTDSFKHLGIDCGICASDYTPDDRLIVFPCSHALHDACYARVGPARVRAVRITRHNDHHLCMPCSK